MQTVLGTYEGAVERALQGLTDRDVVRRIWQGDHTVWKPDPKEITNRLGWLDVVDEMRAGIPELESFAQEVRTAGFRHVVLLGMGGSSLGPEVLGRVLGRNEVYPDLIVLDSIDPDWIRDVTERIQPAHTLFLVSSKSGTTIEPLLLFEHFKALTEAEVGPGKAGDHFVAVTDPGTPLAKRARDEGFRRVFENQPDIGGRYSVLSYFGLVPAALAGVGLSRLLDTAQAMKQACGAEVSAGDNPGCTLGAIMGALALNGRDKLTVITSPAVDRFVLWVEQLIAESTGKEGKGIVPIVGEPLADPRHYGDDRLFVYVRLQGDDNAQRDDAVSAIGASGQPLITMTMKDRYDLGGEFFKWEFAVPVAGSLLGINPFDQPDVQSAKDATAAILRRHEETGMFPVIRTQCSMEKLLAEAGPGKYLAVMAYVEESAQTDEAVSELRRQVMERYRIATTFGYGPRLLHSTGQLHKGGPPSGLFVQLTVDHTQHLPVPGERYTFGELTNAQAAGDLQVLQGLGRSVINVHSSGGDATAVEELLEQWSRAE